MAVSRNPQKQHNKKINGTCYYDLNNGCYELGFCLLEKIKCLCLLCVSINLESFQCEKLELLMKKKKER